MNKKISRKTLLSLVKYEVSKAAEEQRIAATKSKAEKISMLKAIDERFREIFFEQPMADDILVSDEGIQLLCWAINFNKKLIRKG